jgi:hypothetical protein
MYGWEHLKTSQKCHLFVALKPHQKTIILNTSTQYRGRIDAGEYPYNFVLFIGDVVG